MKKILWNFYIRNKKVHLILFAFIGWFDLWIDSRYRFKIHQLKIKNSVITDFLYYLFFIQYLLKLISFEKLYLIQKLVIKLTRWDNTVKLFIDKTNE